MGQYFHTSDIWVNIIIFYIFCYLRELPHSLSWLQFKLYTHRLGAAFEIKLLNTLKVHRKLMFSNTAIATQPSYGNFFWLLFKNNLFLLLLSFYFLSGLFWIRQNNHLPTCIRASSHEQVYIGRLCQMPSHLIDREVLSRPMASVSLKLRVTSHFNVN